MGREREPDEGSDERAIEEWRARVGPAVADVRARIGRAAERAGRDPAAVRLVAVTKTHPVEAVAAAVWAGATDIGENHAVDLRDKAAAFARLSRTEGDALPPPVWHFLGKLQAGTVRHVADVADVVQSGEPGGGIERLARRRGAAARPPHTNPIDVLIEVDFTGTRQGVAPDGVLRFADELAVMDALRCRGLMTIAPITPSPEGARPWFDRLRRLGERLRNAHPEAGELSMGMSVDYEIGVEEGATMVRVGTALFGPRAART
jgi:PLP dependent protein